MPKWFFILAWVGLLWGIVWLYAPALKFGLIWDDPEWFGRIVGRSVVDLVKPVTDFQFYRPGTMLYNRLFWGTDGPLAVYALHWTQLGWHLVGITAVYTLSRFMGFTRWSAYAAAGLVAVYPFSHQAVSWAAPQQPLAAAWQTLAWVLFLWSQNELAKGQSGRVKYRFSLLLFVLALTVQESAIALAIVPLLLDVTRRGGTAVFRPLFSSSQRAISSGWQRPFLYLLLALAYLFLWLLAPRESGITRLGWEPEVFAYLGQGFVYPALWLLRRATWSVSVWLIVMALLIAGLWGLGVARGRGRQVTAGLGWALSGVLPSLIGLPYSYLSFSPRTLYYAAPGVAWLVVGAFWPSERRSVRGWPSYLASAVGLAVLGLIAVGSVRQVADFQALYATGATHLQAAVAVMAEEVEKVAGNGRFLFINFPDRYAPKASPYPFGYWGVTLAPVVVALDEFAALQEGGTAQSASWAMPWIDETARANGPFQIDMRGVITPPEELYRLAADNQAIWLTNYDENGRFTLHHAGNLQPGAAPVECSLAQFGNGLCLHQVQVDPVSDGLRLTFVWSVMDEVNPQATIFVHAGPVGQPPIAQADGDLWRGMLPLRFAQSGDLIVDERFLPLPEGVDVVSLQEGAYDRVSGERLPAQDTAERPLPDNAYVWEQPLRASESP